MHLANPCRLFLSTLLAALLHVTDGCGRTPARTKPPPTTPTAPGPGSTSDPLHTTPRPSHRLVCTPAEKDEAACLHGGECFVLDLLDTRSAHCHCPERWKGLRCEEIDDGFFDRVLPAGDVTKGGIAAGAVVIVIIVTVIIVYLIVKKRKARRKRAEENGQANGHVRKHLIYKEGAVLECPPECGALTEKSETNV
ncbi:uncharacterized protein LOC106013970 [Aplysia californica]|uniref:Uncharacterized protein LOC106013970 n=1 Tax=Aplysia californica TaxID=6500 RepID=A0ABM1AEY5_APLCA|nr:uncharacterized protein LOC106013970 [Aplysia californica]